MTKVRILSEADVRSLIASSTALEFARSILRKQATDGSCVSTPSAMKLDTTPSGGPRFMFKAATVGHLKAVGIRLVAWPAGDGSDTAASMYSVLLDHATGALSAVVSATWLGHVRAAAFGVAAIEPLLRPGRALTVGMFGTGNVAREIARMLLSTFHLAELRVISQRAERAQMFAAELGKGANCVVRAEIDPLRVVANADLVITATTSTEPLISRGMLSPGAVVCSMGSGNEVAYEVLAEVDRLIVDDPDYAAAMGDAGAWIAQGRLSKQRFSARIDALAAEVAAGYRTGRMADSDRILCLIQGMATGDVAFAHLAVQLAEEQSMGQVVLLGDD